MLNGFPHFLFTAWTGLEQGLQECGCSFDFWSKGGFWPRRFSFGLAAPMGMTALAAETGVLVWRFLAEIERAVFACPLLDPFCIPVRLPSSREDPLVERKVDCRWQRREDCLPFIG